MSFRKRSRQEREMAEELQFHLEEQVQRNLAAGMNPEEARRAARRQLGGRDQIEEECRDARGGRWRHELWQDLRYALRLMRRQPGFSVAVIFIFALGIGSTAAVYSVVDAVLLRPLPVERPDELMVAWETNRSRDVTQFSVSYPNYSDWKERSQSWVELAALDRRSVNHVVRGEPQRVTAEFQSANALATLGVTVAMGRRFAPAEDQPGSSPVAIISDGFWRRQFGADPDVLGEGLAVDGRVYSVIGVLPPGVGLSSDVDLVLPLGPIVEPDRTDHGLVVVGRLRPQVTLAEAQTEMQTIAQQLAAEYPDENAGWSVRLEPLFNLVVPPTVQRILQVLLGAVALLLVIACFNVAGLLLVRTAGRTRELAVRAALGGSRGRLVRQLATESVVLALIGGMVGALLAGWMLAWLQGWQHLRLPRTEGLGLSAQVLAVTWLLALVSGLVAGAVPAFPATRLNQASQLVVGAHLLRGRLRLRHALVVAQLALAVVLISAAGLLGRTLDHLRRLDLGYDAGTVLTVQLAPPGDAKQFWAALTERLRALPGVTAVGLTNSPPMADLNTSLHVFPVGPARLLPSESVQAEWRVVNADYFRAVRMPIVRGHGFAADPAADPERAVIVNETLARILWGDEDPIGREINPGGGSTYSTVVGVVADARTRDPAQPAAPGYYLSTQRFVWGHMTLVVRTEGRNARDLLPLLRQEVRALDSSLPLLHVATLQSLVEQRLAARKLVGVLLGSFAAVALVLAAAAIYGVMAFVTAQRTREVGIRVALGASPGHVLRPIIGEGLRLVLAGAGAGVVIGSLLLPLISHLLVEVQLWDGLTHSAAVGFVLLIGAIACYLPARRATRVDPVEALRAE